MSGGWSIPLSIDLVGSLRLYKVVVRSKVMSGSSRHYMVVSIKSNHLFIYLIFAKHFKLAAARCLSPAFYFNQNKLIYLLLSIS